MQTNGSEVPLEVNYKDSFLLDSSFFIEASRRYYAFDIAPSFWQKLKNCAQKGCIFTIDRVMNELKKGNDMLKDWAMKEFSGFVADTKDSKVISAYSDIIEWVYSKGNAYRDQAKNKFAFGADGWIIAHALINGCYVVTQEVFKPDSKKHVSIPNVCEEFDVQYLNTFTLLRKLLVKL